MDVLGIGLACIGALVAIGGSIWLVITTFKQGLSWGLGTLFIPFVSLAFLCVHFKEAWRPALANVVGAIMVFAGLAILIPAHPEIFQMDPFAPPSPTVVQPAAQVR